MKDLGPELVCAQKGLGHQEFSSDSGQCAKSFRGGRRDWCRQQPHMKSSKTGHTKLRPGDSMSGHHCCPGDEILSLALHKNF